MSADVVARGLAAQARRGNPKERIALGVIGQSNERGNVLLADKAAYAQAFGSLRNSILNVPIGPAVSISGGWWHYVYDALFDWGYDTQIVNGAIGSASLVKHVAGSMAFRGTTNNNKVYYAQRLPLITGDRGFIGDCFCYGGAKVYRCTTGQSALAMSAGPFRGIGSNATYLDYMQYAGTALSAGTSPDFATPSAVGQTVVDGGVTWTLESLTSGAYGGTGGQVFTEGQHGIGWDPFGIIQRLYEEMQRVPGVTRRIIYIQNGQSDLASTQTAYQGALVAIANFFLNRGYEVMIGLSCYQPTSDNVANYDKLATARAGALATLRAGSFAAKVLDGANLYALMGIAGPMAAGGAFLQADNIHLNGRGAVGPALSGVEPAGKHVADALKAALPQRAVI